MTVLTTWSSFVKGPVSCGRCASPAAAPPSSVRLAVSEGKRSDPGFAVLRHVKGNEWRFPQDCPSSGPSQLDRRRSRIDGRRRAPGRGGRGVILSRRPQMRSIDRTSDRGPNFGAAMPAASRSICTRPRWPSWREQFQHARIVAARFPGQRPRHDVGEVIVTDRGRRGRRARGAPPSAAVQGPIPGNLLEVFARGRRRLRDERVDLHRSATESDQPFGSASLDAERMETERREARDRVWIGRHHEVGRPRAGSPSGEGELAGRLVGPAVRSPSVPARRDQGLARAPGSSEPHAPQASVQVRDQRMMRAERLIVVEESRPAGRLLECGVGAGTPGFRDQAVALPREVERGGSLAHPRRSPDLVFTHPHRRVAGAAPKGHHRATQVQGPG